jgi:hypothetical protein
VQDTLLSYQELRNDSAGHFAKHGYSGLSAEDPSPRVKMGENKLRQGGALGMDFDSGHVDGFVQQTQRMIEAMTLPKTSLQKFDGDPLQMELN